MLRAGQHGDPRPRDGGAGPPWCTARWSGSAAGSGASGHDERGRRLELPTTWSCRSISRSRSAAATGRGVRRVRRAQAPARRTARGGRPPGPPLRRHPRDRRGLCGPHGGGRAGRPGSGERPALPSSADGRLRPPLRGGRTCRGGRLGAAHPGLARVVLEHAYAGVLSRPGLSPAGRELLAVGCLAASDLERQLASHARAPLALESPPSGSSTRSVRPATLGADRQRALSPAPTGWRPVRGPERGPGSSAPEGSGRSRPSTRTCTTRSGAGSAPQAQAGLHGLSTSTHCRRAHACRRAGHDRSPPLPRTTAISRAGSVATVEAGVEPGRSTLQSIPGAGQRAAEQPQLLLGALPAQDEVVLPDGEPDQVRGWKGSRRSRSR